MITELVISTYQKPGHLALVLSTLAKQRQKPQSVCIADDGSDNQTESMLNDFAKTSAVPLRHIWHEDRGFRKTQILNEAVRSSTADYMIFIDDDCLMHVSFIERHLQLARVGRFLTGSLIRLSDKMTTQFLDQRRVDWTAKDRLFGWQPQNLSEQLKSMPLPVSVMGILDRLSPVRRSWAGCNASTFREHILAVNGFDNRMEYGGLDREFGERLENAGITGLRIRYRAICLHLDHSREYARSEKLAFNNKIREYTKANKSVRTDYGISEISPESASVI